MTLKIVVMTIITLICMRMRKMISIMGNMMLKMMITIMILLIKMLSIYAAIAVQSITLKIKIVNKKIQSNLESRSTI